MIKIYFNLCTFERNHAL